jgi:NAD(P)-dependent dehydrogenase (short-subunit alcohol dehydrogenase family)
MFVTGGSRGIGASIVENAAAAGWDVGFTYVHNEAAAKAVAERARAHGAKVEYWPLDVRDSTAVDAVADEMAMTFDGVDAVICNAGVNINGLAYSMSDDDWSTVIDTNLTGTFYVCRAFLPELVANKGGRILMMSSITATGASGQIAYSASKAGLQGMAQTLAKEYGPKGITTNVLVPGYFDTDMTRGDGMADTLREFAITYCPQRRLGELDELAATVLFLCSSGAGFVNGAVVPVTGGLGWAP